MTMTSFSIIEGATRKYSDSYQHLVGIVQELNAEIDSAKRAKMTAIKAAVRTASERKAELKALIEANSDAFQKPRTLVLYGVKVGLQKGKGGITFDDAADVVARIEKLLPDQSEALISVKKTPDKSGLASLSVQELKRLGCEVEDTGDQVVIKPTDGNVEKLVEAMLKGCEE
jgi:hypothetical protein